MNKYIIKKLSNIQYYWVLEDVYGGFLMKSPIFATKSHCESSIIASKLSLLSESFVKHQSPDGQHYFTQVSFDDKKVLATGKMYDEMIDRDIDITLVKSMAKLSEIIDATMHVA